MDGTQHLLFIACVAVASYVQNLTGFALGLVLLGLVGLLHAAPLAEVTNVVSILAIVNGALLFHKGLPRLERATIVPTLATSLIGVGLGVWLLNWFSDHVVLGLRLLLGLTIAGAAVLLLLQATPLARRSRAWVFAAFGLVSGVFGGLFSTAGPPLVYHFYRQPMEAAQLRAALTLIFAANAAVRLALQAGAGRVGADALWMSLEAAPVVIALTLLAVRCPHRWSPRAVRRCVAGLLALVAAGLVVPAARELLRGGWG